MAEWRDYTYFGPGGGYVAINDTVSGGTTNSILKVAAGPLLAQIACSSDPGAAWATYTPTLAAGTGTFTSASASGRWLQIGKILFIQVGVTITTNGSAANTVTLTLPNSLTAAGSYAIVGRELVVAGKQLQGFTAGSSGTLTIVNYDNSYPGSSGAILAASGVVEVQ